MIIWRKFDPEHPPTISGNHLISDGKNVDIALFDDNLWFVSDMSSIDGSDAVTHYAKINLPNEKTHLMVVTTSSTQ
ncbi:hypothetical protein [Alicyclobacillus fodiniaquatilis]|uniref:Uncharacterized protein n=1 Tax=Alicyclobacillus fodiniaquatilis TaxID=1661150 RepID=A0ABW4JIG7_9BACL